MALKPTVREVGSPTLWGFEGVGSTWPQSKSEDTRS